MSDINSPLYEPQTMKPWASGPAAIPADPPAPPSGITAPDVASIFSPVAAAPSITPQTDPQSPLAVPATIELEDDLDSMTPAKPASNGGSASAWKRCLSGAGLFLCGAACGVVGIKFAAPRWLAPATASARVAPPPAPDDAPPAPADSPTAKSTARRTPPAAAADAQDDEGARTQSLLSLLHTVRRQIELYKAHHHDRLPEMSKYPAWAQLTRRTRADGTLSPAGVYGPYLPSPPTNPLNGFAGIGLTRRAPSPGDVMRAEKLGFIYVTTTGQVIATEKDGKTIFDELAARGEAPGDSTRSSQAPNSSAPSRAESAESRLRSTMSMLATLRGQLEVYKLHHNDRYPDFMRHANWEQLLRKTGRDGGVLASPAKESYGPYLAQTPANPLNGHAEVIQVSKLSAYRPSARKIGYVFETSTGKLYATDNMGLPIRE